MKIDMPIVAVACVTLLSACGGASTGGSSFEALSSRGQALLSQYGTAPVTNVANMPTTDNATYRGVAAYSSDYSSPIDIAQYATTVSDVELTANFANSTITGHVDNFQQRVDPNISMSGRVDVVNGTISGNTFNAGLSGTVTESGYGLTIPVNYTGSVNGEFVGSGAESVRGTGTAVGDAGIYGQQTVYTLWGAVRD